MAGNEIEFKAISSKLQTSLILPRPRQAKKSLINATTNSCQRRKAIINVQKLQRNVSKWQRKAKKMNRFTKAELEEISILKERTELIRK